RALRGALVPRTVRLRGLPRLRCRDDDLTVVTGCPAVDAPPGGAPRRTVAPARGRLLLGDGQFTAAVETFPLLDDARGHGRTSAGLRIRGPPGAAYLLGVPKQAPGDLLSVLGPVRKGTAQTLRVGAGRHALSNSPNVPG